ncbi:MAG: phosphotriesterase-related protein [Chloroflexi bacterium]|nr:phosphotriesterase-related protein [Chloroflexota bacterium]
MTEAANPGKVQTVLGLVDPGDLGVASTHEHLLIDFSLMLRPPVVAPETDMTNAPLTLENMGWIRHNHYSNLNNLLMLDEEAAIAEVALYGALGGGTIVDATTIGIGRNPRALVRIAQATGVNIVMGAGYYVAAVHPADMDSKTEDEIAAQITSEVRDGVDDTSVRAGIIGEIGCTWPLADNERKVLRASARAQRETGAAILIHPGRDEAAPQEIIEVLAEAGADIERTIIGHLDRTITDLDVLSRLADSGCYLEWDLFGNESSHYPLSDFDMPSDAQRLDFIRHVVDRGFGDKVLMAHDICTNHRLVKYGGHGYGHIVQNIVPRMRRKGFSEETIRKAVIENPARILALV